MSLINRLGPGPTAALFYFCFFASQAAFNPFLSVFFAHSGLSGSEIGLLAAVGPLMSLLVAPSISAVADRRGWRMPLLVLSLASSALVLLLFPLAPSFAWFLPVVALLYGVGTPALSIADGLVARMTARRGLSYGKMRLWGSLSWAIVAAAGGALWQNVGLWLMFPLASLLIFVTIPFARRLEDDHSSDTGVRPPLRVVMGDIRLRVVLGATFVLGFAMATTSIFNGVYLDKEGGQLLVGVFYGIMAISELPIMHWSEAIRRRLGGPMTLVSAYLLLGGSYLGVALIHSPILLAGIAVIQGLGFGLFLPTTVRLVADWVPPEWSSTSQGLLNASLWGLAPLIAGPIGGVVYDGLGPAAVFLGCVGAALLAGLVIVLAQAVGVFKKKDDYSGAVTIVSPQPPD